MRVLVTGATGFIGSHAVAQLLEAGHLVRVLVRNAEKLQPVLGPLGHSAREVEIQIGSLESSEAIERGLSDCEGLLHCAGLFSPNREDESLLQKTNVDGTRTILEAAARANALERVVYVSSMLALFPPHGETISADDPVTEPTSMYARTKAEADRIARRYQDSAAETKAPPLSILYPAAVQGPDDPTFSIGPQLVANAVQEQKVLVTEGGLAYSDVRDVARTIVAIFDERTQTARLMSPSFFVPHETYKEILERLTERPITAQRVPGWALRAMGRVGDFGSRFGWGGDTSTRLTYEAASILTRSVPVADAEARHLLGREPITADASFRDLIEWMRQVGHLEKS